ncbi:MAG: hypothetical protein M9921_14465 [Fimbriimonadaceae bacterium]|nr:hypothetical protein [Chthonomonadaceae bacterium]MCO5298048.1 hypothetical protein [Fimbriimonadaceae bacterium]
MKLTESRFRALVAELLDENPVAIRPVLKILRIRFTEEVPTLAVTLEERPRLLVNLGFLASNCASDEHVKACVVHEFLHVVLGHTERFRHMDTGQNVALDAVINAIIHRTMGVRYSGFFLKFYGKEKGVFRMLRPANSAERRGRRREPSRFEQVWDGVYEGRLVADDILGLACRFPNGVRTPLLIGNHDAAGGSLPKALEDAVGESMRSMNGDGIWRSPKDRGVGASAYEAVVAAPNPAKELWRRRTFEALRECVVPDRRAPIREVVESEYRVPVLSARDRRAFLRTLWSPIMPDAGWCSTEHRPTGYANVYLDVSGSMNAEMPDIIALLASLRRAIRMPFWAFSDEVEPATIRDGALVTRTTGGTSMRCVLEHLAHTRPPAAVVVTDGYIEEVDPRAVRALGSMRLRAIVTRDGNPGLLERAGIPTTQLEELPR